MISFKVQNSDMTESTLTLNLYEPVTHKLLPDLEALLPPSDLSVLRSSLSEQPQATVVCSQTHEVCALLAAAIITWLRLCKISAWYDNQPLDTQTLTVESLYARLMAPHAHLRLAF